MRACIDAWQQAEEKLRKICAAAELDYEFIGDHYPMQCIVRTRKETEQVQLDEMQDDAQRLEAVYKCDSRAVWWKYTTSAEIDNDLHNKIVSAFKALCNAYAYYRFSEYLGC